MPCRHGLCINLQPSGVPLPHIIFSAPYGPWCIAAVFLIGLGSLQ
jgi:hypothetical protein